MALYTKQDFSPPILSRRWFAMKFRPNMLIYSRHHVISILESGLLFREDSIEVEQETPGADEVWRAAGGGKGGWLTRGEGAVSVVAVAVCVAAFPPRTLQRSALLNVAAYASIPVAIRATHRALVRGALANLLASMRDYLALARRAAACLKEYAALHAQLGSISSAIESTRTLLCRQQSSLAVVMSRASSALLGNAPWLRADVAWSAVEREPGDNLMKIHHAFLVVQSTLLKHIAMAHYIPSAHAQKIYKNHNERIYWLHTVLIEHLNDEFRQNYEALERMYRLLRNFGNNDSAAVKKPGSAMLDSWAYSDIHNGVARTNLELKLALNKCNALDVFLDSCALNKQELDLSVLNKDVDEIIDDITKCLTTMQNSQIRLKKLRSKVAGEKEIRIEEKDPSDDENLVKIDDKVPEVKDEVFYFVKTEDDDVATPANDVTTAPGKKEKETTKIVLNELKRKLGKREDVMRERERQALVKTMPEFKDHVPEFPRQIHYEDFVIRKGYLTKIKKDDPKRRLFRNYRIRREHKDKKYTFKTQKYQIESEIAKPYYEANSKLNFKSKLLSVSKEKDGLCITRWTKYVPPTEKSKELDSSGMSEGLSDVEAGTANRTINQAINDVQNGHSNEARNFKFSKKDLELSPSSSESDFEFYKEKQLALLKDVRRHRAARKKNFPSRRSIDKSIDKEDESLKPIEYSFGTGMAMASVLQINSNAKMPNLAQEEVFIGNGEVSTDSGNDEDA
ncbi:hypothetical protein ABMA27_012640 [Loxostege sticticalis]|uniref:Uncharacterized protein n=2 Tax=Loxostege sticticalis TaxID=481309 RepID=A0ABR3GZC1_LOXSC